MEDNFQTNLPLHNVEIDKGIMHLREKMKMEKQEQMLRHKNELNALREKQDFERKQTQGITSNICKTSEQLLEKHDVICNQLNETMIELEKALAQIQRQEEELIEQKKKIAGLERTIFKLKESESYDWRIEAKALSLELAMKSCVNTNDAIDTHSNNVDKEICHLVKSIVSL